MIITYTFEIDTVSPDSDLLDIGKGFILGDRLVIQNMKSWYRFLNDQYEQNPEIYKELERFCESTCKFDEDKIIWYGFHRV